MTRVTRITAMATAMLLGLVALGARPAQSASVYSMVLLGERLEAGDVRSISLGTSAHLVLDTLSVMHYNQALLAHLNRVTIGASQFVAMDEARSDTYAEQDNSFAITTLQAAFPIWNKFTLSVGYRGRYDPNGSFSVRQTAPSGDTYTETFRKSGGLFSVPLTVAFRLTRFLSLSGTVSIERGYVEERWDKVFDDPTFNPGASIKKEEVSGSGFGAAAVVHPLPGLMLGGTFESQIDYDTDVSTRFTQPGLDTTYTAKMVLPARYTYAASYSFKGWMVLAGGYYSDFTKFEGLAFDQTRLRTEWDASMGIEWTEGVPIRGSRVPLRLSVSVGELPFDHPRGPGAAGGEAVSKVVFGIGTGFPIRDGKGKIDFGIQIGQIGSLDTNGLEDSVFRFYFGLAGGEEWKRKARAQGL